ncbi:MAG: OmpA family protein [Thermoanaerobacteraceae bacterium]|nr:OmpA family protein [Thermoanaerobacteraceae bacterium]
MSQDKKGAPAWMVTYSDLVTLLLVFFVLLYSFSVLDVQKFKAFLISFQGVGILEKGSSILENIEANRDQMEELSEGMDEISENARLLEVYTVIKAFLKNNGLEDDISVRYEERGVVLTIKEKILFDSGKADLKPHAKKILAQLGNLFKQLPNQISVEGHTDNRPINTIEFPSNWELSAARSARVVRYLTREHNLDPRRFVAVGFGEYYPVASNDTPEGRARNRRVVIVINSKNIYESGGNIGEETGTKSGTN